MRKTLILCSLLVIASLAACSTRGTTPLTGEPILASPPAETGAAPATDAAPAASDEAAVSLQSVPVVPTVSPRMKDVFEAGVAGGRNPAIFSKVGDCMTDSPQFLFPYADGIYELGEYGDLQAAIELFSTETIRDLDGKPLNSFNNESLSVSCGFNSASPNDPTWANPNFCESDESPLLCELRVSNASVVLIMLGTHDLHYEREKFETYLDRIVQDTLSVNVVPILTTFPPRTDDLENSEHYNGVVIEVAQKYDVPVANLWLALQDLPGQGIQTDHATALSLPPDGCATCFTDENLQYGATMQNWVALMALQQVLAAVSP